MNISNWVLAGILAASIVVIFICVWKLFLINAKYVRHGKQVTPKTIEGKVQAIGCKPFGGIMIDGRNYMIYSPKSEIVPPSHLTPMIGKRVRLHYVDSTSWSYVKGIYARWRIIEVRG